MSTENKNNINERVYSFIMNLKYNIKNAINKVSAYAKKNRDERDYKKLLINSMTIPELEKVYKSYVNQSLEKEIQDPNDFNKKINVRINLQELKRSLSWRVASEQMLYIIPRLKKVTVKK